jgi:hypothetical protein
MFWIVIYLLAAWRSVSPPMPETELTIVGRHLKMFAYAPPSGGWERKVDQRTQAFFFFFFFKCGLLSPERCQIFNMCNYGICDIWVQLWGLDVPYHYLELSIEFKELNYFSSSLQLSSASSYVRIELTLLWFVNFKRILHNQAHFHEIFHRFIWIDMKSNDSESINHCSQHWSSNRRYQVRNCSWGWPGISSNILDWTSTNKMMNNRQGWRIVHLVLGKRLVKIKLLIN